MRVWAEAGVSVLKDTVMVSNLATSVTEEDIITAFSECGDIEHVQVSATATYGAGEARCTGATHSCAAMYCLRAEDGERGSNSSRMSTRRPQFTSSMVKHSRACHCR